MEPIIEKQRLYQNKVVWFILLGALSFEVVVFYAVGAMQHDAIRPLIAIFTLMVMIFLLAMLCSLETRYSPAEIEFRFSPFHFKFRKIPVSEMKSITMRTYKPLREYGGWGIRGFKKNRAYNVSGNEGVQVELKNGNKILFGTNDPTKLTDMVMQINRNIK